MKKSELKSIIKEILEEYIDPNDVAKNKLESLKGKTIEAVSFDVYRGVSIETRDGIKVTIVPKAGGNEETWIEII